MITHLTDPEAFGSETLVIEGDAYRHLFRSRRVRNGAELRVVDGLGNARRGVVSSVSKTTAKVSLGRPIPSGEPTVQLELVVGALRPERADFLVEKATELGAVAIRFLRTERTPRRYGASRVGRWSRVAASAVEQCHRSRLPDVTVHAEGEVVEILEGITRSRGRSFVLAPGGDGVLTSGAADPIAVLVGPEGGFSADEMARLRDLGAVSVDLGERVLRVETAALAAASKLLLP
ncbi:MAG: 16S rRNA (uracil(1498)-N(3))-methyltransferase [Thermoanaerobaculia bacterium]|nr:16S rRNA (uracil(1498)-N(3))-methyltransferase [Thermoanaerobaculia bacterium]